MAARTYIETFDNGPGGWIGWATKGASKVVIENGIAVSRSPWWVDVNHAPPGGGYLHLLYCLHTNAAYYSKQCQEMAGVNRFIEGGYPLNFTNAKITVRVKGELKGRGANVVLLAQAKVGDRTLNHVLTGQPVNVTKDWSEQTLKFRHPDLTETRFAAIGCLKSCVRSK